MRLLLLQFITCNMKPIVFPVAACAQTHIFQQTGMRDDKINLDKNNWSASMAKI